MPLIIKVAGKTDVGLVRPGNEDYLHIDEDHHVYAVCDGMGGHLAGEVASMTASDTLRLAFDRFPKELLNETHLTLGKSLPESGELLVKAIRLANREICNQASKDTTKSGMGTTIASVVFEADIMSIAHVGDSRVYRLDEKQLTPLTTDHSWVAEMETQQGMSRKEAESVVGKNIITRALGVRTTVEVDYSITKVEPGNKFILCSDGLCGFVDDDEIFDVANKYRDDIEQITDNLIRMANDRGGADNVTIVTLEVEQVIPSPLPELDGFTQKGEDDDTITAENELLTKFTEYRELEAIGIAKPKKKSSQKLVVPLIFLLFLVVAVAVIYVSTIK